MRSGVAARCRNRHKTDTGMKKQGNLIPCKERQDTIANWAYQLGRKRFGTIRHNNQRQEKTTFLELVRMRSPVQIWIAAPKNSRNRLISGVFVLFSRKIMRAGKWVSVDDPQLDPHGEMRGKVQRAPGRKFGLPVRCFWCRWAAFTLPGP